MTEPQIFRFIWSVEENLEAPARLLMMSVVQDVGDVEYQLWQCDGQSTKEHNQHDSYRMVVHVHNYFFDRPDPRQIIIEKVSAHTQAIAIFFYLFISLSSHYSYEFRYKYT